MTCHNCRIEASKAGKRRDGGQRYRCSQCGKTFSEHKEFGLFGHKQIDESRGLLALKLLVEGNSIRTTERVTGLHRDTITKLLLIAGEKCAALLATQVRGVPVDDVQCDEIWGFCRKKEGHKHGGEQDFAYVGDAWVFVAIERNSKLILAHDLGKRTLSAATRFMSKLAVATDEGQRFQLTTDGLPAYMSAVVTTLGARVDYAQLIKTYADNPAEEARRYSPAPFTGAIKEPMLGDPEDERICTSHIERQNLTMRMSMRRFTRLTNGFSKSWEHLRAAVALHFAHYNFCRKHITAQDDSGGRGGDHGSGLGAGGVAGCLTVFHRQRNRVRHFFVLRQLLSTPF